MLPGYAGLHLLAFAMKFLTKRFCSMVSGELAALNTVLSGDGFIVGVFDTKLQHAAREVAACGGRSKPVMSYAIVMILLFAPGDLLHEVVHRITIQVSFCLNLQRLLSSHQLWLCTFTFITQQNPKASH